MYKNVELRKLPSDVLCKVINILEINDDWKKVMSIIPKSLQSHTGETKFSREDIRLIEEHSKNYNLKCTEILLEEWGSSGRVRPTLTHLKNILTQAQIYRAADEIAKMIEDTLPVRPTNGPAAPISTNVTEILDEESRQQRLRDMGSVDKSNTNDLGDKTTQEMKSVSNMIEFSETIVKEPITLQQYCGNGMNDQPSVSDMMKFSREQQYSQVSMNVPHLSAMLHSDTSRRSNSMSIDAQTDTDISNSNNTESKSHNQTYNPVDYQTTFPNITITTEIDSVILQDTNLLHFEYNDLKYITGNFSENVSNGPEGLKGKIGSGGFGAVFVGKHTSFGLVAVKKCHDHLQLSRKPGIAMRVFNTEVKFLLQFRHDNIVPILGISMDGPVPCIVCEYIDGGSLQQKIDEKCLNEDQRINIMAGTAEGLKYLHTSKKHLENKNGNSTSRTCGENDSQNTTKNFVHGDVKTANILLTKDYIPKLCDFGLAKQYDTTCLTTCPMGTSAYMAPEGIHGTVTQKIDIFSFGIVLLELLTGLKPIFVIDNENIHIKLYVEENTVNNDISPLLDPVVNNWTRATDVYNLAKRCLENNRQNRPSITEVCNILNRLNN